jgi:2',3'-cyclic-nucleotide 2'-phosphodiesterase (5'-nucleotidase family)
MLKNIKVMIPRAIVISAVTSFIMLMPSLFVSAKELDESAASGEKIKQATIIFAADLPLIDDEEIGDYAQLATVLEEHRRLPKNTFFLFGGRSIGPSPMAVFDRGSHIIDILNSLEPDAYSIANREFSYFEDELSLRSFEAAFPMVSSNLIDVRTGNNLDGLVKSALIHKGNFKLGVMSILSESVVEEYRLSRISVENSFEAIRRVANDLRERDADVVVLFYPYASELIEQLYHENVIDVSLSADLNISLLGEASAFEHKNDIFLDEAGEVAVVELTFNPDSQEKEAVSVEWNSIFLKGITADDKVAKQVAGYSDRLDRLLSQELGVLTTPLDTRRLSVRTRENAFGNFIVDAVRRYAGANISLVNGGVIRGGKLYSPYTVLTRRDIALELPFRGRLVVIEVSGQQIWQAIENGLSAIEEVKGRFPHVSGMTVTYDSQGDPGHRVSDIQVDGQAIELDKLYSLATTDYQAQGGDGYSSLVAARKYNDKRNVVPLVSDIVINEILVSGSIAPKVEKRLIDISAED